MLSAYRPAELPAWGWNLPVGGGTYHALFPRAWQTFEPDESGLGVRLVGEQLSPVIAGDFERSALPVGVFEWWVENPGPDPLTVGLLFTWADPPAGPEAGAAPGRPHEVVHTPQALGVTLGDPGPGAPTALRGTMAIGALEAEGWTLSARADFDPIADTKLWADFAADGRLDPHPMARPVAPRGGPSGAAVAATTILAPGERRSVRFALAWDLPVVEFGGGRRWWKRYTRDWGRTGLRAWDLAGYALEEAASWRTAVEAWQAPYLADPDRPDWYTMALFNELYFLVDGGTFWEAGEVGGIEPTRDDIGRFALLECLDYPFYDTVDVDFYASFALLELYPELEQQGIRDLLAAIPVDDPHVWTVVASGLEAPRKVGWTVPHDVGGPADDPFLKPNWYHFQDVSLWKDLGPKFVLQVWRDAVAAGAAAGDALIRDAFPTVERVMERLAESDRDGDGLPEHDGIPDQTYDTWPMRGPSAYGGSLWLAACAAAEAMAGRLGDREAAGRWAGWFERAQVAFDVRLWRGDHYAYDDGGGPSSESLMADQLAGQWYADATGLGPLLPDDRVDDGPAHHPRPQRGWLRWWPDGRGQRDPPGRLDRRLERAIGRGLGRDDLRPGGVHDGPRVARGGLGDGRRRRGGHLRTRPVVSDARGLRRRRELPRLDVPPAAGDLGHRGGPAPVSRDPLARGRLGARRRRTGRCVAGPPPGLRTTSRSTSARARRPTARRHSPGPPPRAPR